MSKGNIGYRKDILKFMEIDIHRTSNFRRSLPIQGYTPSEILNKGSNDTAITKVNEHTVVYYWGMYFYSILSKVNFREELYEDFLKRVKESVEVLEEEDKLKAGFIKDLLIKVLKYKPKDRITIQKAIYMITRFERKHKCSTQTKNNTFK
jgi:hypothetical protein